MTWRVRGDDDKEELAILRGLVDELSLLVSIEFANEHGDKSLTDFNEHFQKTIWLANNTEKANGEKIWWPRHISVGEEIHLIEEILDDDMKVVETRTKHIY